ncbi:MAG: transporter [Verrucomicrobiota bacterium]
MIAKWSWGLVLALLAQCAVAADKSGYHLFRPTPAGLLRPMDTDGPGTTESPYTVDAGHFQVELTLLSYATDRGSYPGVDYEFDYWAVAPMLLKVGLLNRLDAQFGLEPHNVLRERAGGIRTTSRGFGDTTVRLKYNVWGNDRGRTALALTPYVRIPTSQNNLGSDGIEGGLVVPWSADLPRDFWLGLTTRFDVVRDVGGRGHHPEFANSIAVGHDLSGKWFGYVEFFTIVSTERDTDWVGSVNPGLIHPLNKNVWLNAGVNIGVTRAATDWNPFIGMSWRF